MKKIMMIMSLLLSTSAFALPSTVEINEEALHVARVLLVNSTEIQKALKHARIAPNANISNGSVTRDGLPGDYTDEFSFGLSSCGPTPTSPCYFEGNLIIDEDTTTEMGQTKVSYRVSIKR